jgi:hypothetical protein
MRMLSRHTIMVYGTLIFTKSPKAYPSVDTTRIFTSDETGVKSAEKAARFASGIS